MPAAMGYIVDFLVLFPLPSVRTIWRMGECRSSLLPIYTAFYPEVSGHWAAPFARWLYMVYHVTLCMTSVFFAAPSAGLHHP
eukprot:12885567-Prorocentrum_lima.AAC.1